MIRNFIISFLAGSLLTFGQSSPQAINDNVTTTKDNIVVIDVQQNDVDPDGDNLTTSIISVPSDGTVEVINGVNIRYSPRSGFVGNNSFTYQICDGSNNCDQADVFVSVRDSNDGIFANDDNASTTVGNSININVQDNDTCSNSKTTCKKSDSCYEYEFLGANDNDDGTTTVSVRITTNCDRSLSYAAFELPSGNPAVSPNSNYSSNYSYSIENPTNQPFFSIKFEAVNAEGFKNGNSDTFEYTINSADYNPNDNIRIQTKAANEFGQVVFKPSECDQNCCDNLTTSITGAPQDGTAVVEADQTITYTPEDAFSGMDTLNYQICNDCGDCDDATVKIFVNDPNTGPTAVDDTDSTPKNTAVTTDVQSNDTDPNNDPLTTSILSSPSNGTVSVINNDQIRYVPATGFTGVDTYNYQVCDASGACDQAMVTIDVRDTNQPPVATNDEDSTQENSSVITDILDNDTDPDGDSLLVEIVNNPTNGSVELNGDNTVTYIPNTGYSGNDSYRYEICDGNGGCDTADVFISISDINNAPIANDDSSTTDENTSVVIDVQDNDSDPDGDVIKTSIVTGPDNGAVTVINNNQVEYSPDTDFSGSDTFTYQVCDNDGLCSSANVTVSISTVNDPPVAVDDQADTQINTPVTIDVQVNDSDPEGEDLSTSIITGPSNGSISLNGNSIDYNPNNNFVGNDTFTYQVCDPAGLCDQADVVVMVRDAQQPTAREDAASTPQDTAVDIDVQANDSEPQGEDLTTSINTTPENGNVVVNDDQSVTYTPNTGFAGEDSFTYQICDPNGNCDEAIVVVNVVIENNAPMAQDDTVQTNEDTTVDINVLDNDTDPENDELSTSIVSFPENGSVNISMNVHSYTPDENFIGTDTYVYEACDGNGLCDQATVTINVVELNQSPICRPDEATTNENSEIDIDVLANDNDPEDGVLEISQVGDADHGSTEIINGLVRYTPETDFFGTDTFSYGVCDDAGNCCQSTVTVTIIEGNDPPNLGDDDCFIVPINRTTTFDILSNDTDPNGDEISINITEQPENGMAVVVSGKVKYIPRLNYVGSDEINYEVCDDEGLCTSGTICIEMDFECDDVLSIDDVSAFTDTKGYNLVLYPNPSNSQSFNIVFPQTQLSGSIEVLVHDLNSRLIYKGSYNGIGDVQQEHEVNLGSTVTAGIYLVTVTNEDFTSSTKLIIE